MSQHNDLEFEWLGDQGATGTLNDRWFWYLRAFEGALPDKFYAWLGSMGYTGHINDRWLAYYENGKYDYVNNFDGVESQASPATAVGLSSTQQFTIAMRLRLLEQRTAESGEVFAQVGLNNATTLTGFTFYASSTGSGAAIPNGLYVQFNNSVAGSIGIARFPAQTLPAGEWVSFVATFDTTAQYAAGYINGQKIDDVLPTVVLNGIWDPDAAGQVLNIGGLVGTNVGFLPHQDFDVSHFMLFDEVLTDA